MENWPLCASLPLFLTPFPPFFHSHSFSHSRKNPITEIPGPCWKRDSLWNVFGVKQRQCLSCARANRKLCAGERCEIRTDNGKRERQRRKKLKQSRGQREEENSWRVMMMLIWWPNERQKHSTVTVLLDPPPRGNTSCCLSLLFTTSCCFLAAWKLIMTSLKKENRSITPQHLNYRENCTMCSGKHTSSQSKNMFLFIMCQTIDNK